MDTERLSGGCQTGVEGTEPGFLWNLREQSPVRVTVYAGSSLAVEINGLRCDR